MTRLSDDETVAKMGHPVVAASGFEEEFSGAHDLLFALGVA
jgi:hypothetical protein